MPELTVEIVNKVSNIGALAEEKAALSAAMGGGFSPVGGGTVNFGGSLTKGEQAVAAEQMALIEGAAKKEAVAVKEVASGFAAYEGKLKSAVIVSGEAGAITDGLARKMSALGSLGLTPMSIGLIGAVAAIGGAIAIGKDWIDIAEKNEAANKSLAQAYEYLGESVPTKVIDDFIQANERFIPDMFAAKNGFASLARAGFDNQMQLRLMNDAVDLAAVKNEDLSSAVTQLIKAHGGNSRALMDLGIVMKDIQDPIKNLAKAHKDVQSATNEHAKAVRTLEEWEARHHDRSVLTAADLMREQDLKIKVTKGTKDLKLSNDELAYAQALVKEKGDKFQALLDVLEPKIKKARETTDQGAQSSSHLGEEWDKLGKDQGPQLAGMMDAIKDKTGDAVGKLDDFLNMLSHSDDGPNSPWANVQNAIIVTVGLLELLNYQFQVAIGNNDTLAAKTGHGGPPGGGRIGQVAPGNSAGARQRGFIRAPVGSN